MQIEVANETNYETLNKLFKELDHYHFLLQPERVNEYTQVARTAEQLNSYTSGDGKVLFIAKLNEEYVGFINLKIEVIEGSYLNVSRKFCLIDNIFVRESFRSKGVATYLVNYAKKWSLEQGVNKVELQVFSSNINAVKFYESMGFDQFSIKMELSL